MRTIIIGLIGLILAGCWDLREVDQRAIVLSLAIDEVKDGRGVTVTLDLPRLSTFRAGAGKSASKESYEMKGQGATLIEAIDKTNLKIARNLFFGHLQTVVIGAGVAHTSFTEVIHTLSRHSYVQRPTLVVIADKSAADLLAVNLPEDQLFSDHMVAFFLQGNRAHRVPHMPLWKLESLMSKPERSLVVPLLASTKGELAVSGLAVIHGDKMVGTMDTRQMQGYMWLKGESGDEIVVLNDGTSVRTYQGRSTIKPYLTKGQPAALIRIMTDAELSEASTEISMSQEQIRTLERAVAARIREQAKNTLATAQEMETDLFGIGRRVKAYLGPRSAIVSWNDWFRNAQFDIQVQVRIRRSGLSL